LRESQTVLSEKRLYALIALMVTQLLREAVTLSREIMQLKKQAINLE